MDETENDPQQARAALAAFEDASRTATSVPVGLGCGLLAAVGVSALGAPWDGWAKLAGTLLGLGLVALAFGVPDALRRRGGRHGYRGGVRQEHVVLAICTAALAVIGLQATVTLAAIFVGLGVIAGVTWFLVLRGVVGAAR